MSSAPNQLVEIHRQLREHFSSHSAISFAPIKGDPPDQYEITYAINGLCKTGSGDIIETSRHVVELTIPFGFPHFPPSCKPKSDIFHPDFDPAAICLGDSWNQDSRVSDLIMYIGQMINGEIYSRTNAFNEDASIWYQDHPETLPLTDIIWNEKEADLDFPDKDNDKPGIDTLDESDLRTGFDFLALEDSKAQEDLPDGSLPVVESAPTLRQDLADFEDIMEDEPADSTDEAALPINKKRAEEEKDPKTAQNRSAKKRGPKPEGKTHRASTLRRIKNVSVYLVGGIGAVIFAGCGYYYWSIMTQLAAADTASLQCSAFVEKEQFEEAKRSCEQALTASYGVKFIHQERVARLREKIDRILQSETFIQGLNGKILVDGMYLPKKDAEIIMTFRQLQKEAEDFFLQENWPQAIDRFAGIIALPQAAQYIPAEVAAEVKSKHSISRFRMAYDSAEKILLDRKWREAIAELEKAEPLLASLPEGDRPHYADLLRKSLARSTFEQSREQGDVFLGQSDWQKAIAAYEIALSAYEDLEDIPKESFETVQKNMKRAELYDLIDQGNKTFGSGFWDEAIANYSKAEAFLTDHQALLKTIDAEMSLRKLSRIILQALIVRDRQLAANHLDKNELKTAGMIYRQLIEEIEKSSFAGESEFRETRTELAATIQTLDEKILLADKVQYLKDNYHTIFIANYPNVIKENLVNPIMSLTRDTGDKMVFKMQCTESGGGRPLTLIMHYAFDKKSNQWEPFSIQQ